VLAASLVAAFAGVALLLALHSLPMVLAASVIAGLAMAPVFPLCSALFMALVPDPAQTRWMFAVAGLGSATFPWITGMLSEHTSLHTGLLVPLAGLGVMLAMMRWPAGGVDLFRILERLPAGGERPAR
jgi:MFS family permease